MTPDPHTGFILAAYLLAFAISAGLALWAVLDYRAQRNALSALDAAGVSRRSSRLKADQDEGSGA